MMTTTMTRPSRLLPCAVLTADGWCGGIAARLGDQYTCTICEATWDKQGEPTNV